MDGLVKEQGEVPLGNCWSLMSMFNNYLYLRPGPRMSGT